jgi:hypothetical protein
MPNFLTPQTAATPSSAMKVIPIARSAVVLLLQPWSTAIVQTMNKTIATAPAIFSNMGIPPDESSTML